MQSDEFADFLKAFRQYFPIDHEWLKRTSEAQRGAGEDMTTSVWFEVMGELRLSDCRAALLRIFRGDAEKWRYTQDAPATIIPIAKEIAAGVRDRQRRVDEQKRMKREDHKRVPSGGFSAGTAYRQSLKLKRKLTERGADEHHIGNVLQDFTSRYSGTGDESIDRWVAE